MTVSLVMHARTDQRSTANAHAVGSLVERNSKLLLFIKLPEFKPASSVDVTQAFFDKMLDIAAPMRQGMSYDKVQEMAMHMGLSRRANNAVYFCYPHSPRQRGYNENMNGLLRQHLPKRTNLSGYSQDQTDAIACQIKNLP